MAGLFNLHGIKFGDGVISSITDQTEDAGIKTSREVLDGEIFPRQPVITEHNPSIEFSTFDLTLLGTLGSIGGSIRAVPGGLTLFYKRRQEEGFFYPNNEPVHRSKTATQGMIVPVSLSWSHNSPVKLSCKIYISQDGINDSWVTSETATLPELSPPHQFSFAKAIVAGQSLPYVSKCDVNFGINVEGAGADGDISEKMYFYSEANPEVTLGGKDLNWCSASGLPEYFAANHDDTAFFFRQWIEAGKYYPASVANAVKIAVSGMAYFQKVGGSGGKPATIDLKIEGKKDGENLPLLITSGVTVPA